MCVLAIIIRRVLPFELVRWMVLSQNGQVELTSQQDYVVDAETLSHMLGEGVFPEPHQRQDDTPSAPTRQTTVPSPSVGCQTCDHKPVAKPAIDISTNSNLSLANRHVMVGSRGRGLYLALLAAFLAIFTWSMMRTSPRPCGVRVGVMVGMVSNIHSHSPVAVNVFLNHTHTLSLPLVADSIMSPDIALSVATSSSFKLAWFIPILIGVLAHLPAGAFADRTGGTFIRWSCAQLIRSTCL